MNDKKKRVDNIPEDTQPEENGKERLFTQAEVNQIVRERLARERSKKTSEPVEGETAPGEQSEGNEDLQGNASDDASSETNQEDQPDEQINDAENADQLQMTADLQQQISEMESELAAMREEKNRQEFLSKGAEFVVSLGMPEKLAGIICTECYDMSAFKSNVMWLYRYYGIGADAALPNTSLQAAVDRLPARYRNEFSR